MRIEATGTGKTIDDAIMNACTKLGVDRDTVTVEVVTAPTKKVLGFMGGSSAEVLAYYDDGTPDEEIAITPEEPVKAEEKKPQKEKKKDIEKPKKARDEKFDDSNATKKDLAEAFLNKIIPYISSKPFTIESEITEENIRFNIEGDDINAIIGRRGETLDALQYLAGIVSSKNGEKNLRVYIDTGKYRARREETLEKLAKKYADRVLKTGRSLTLEPMSPNERRIIHMVIQDIDGLESFSKGEGPARRVVIAPKK